jgi:FKBP-type peptidyl-prolyl cis-trans isomerase (trigger factor)
MHSFEVPASLINSEADDRIAEYERQASQENSNLEITTGQREQMRESILPQAEERVRQMILIERIRESEGLNAGPEEVDAHLAGLAVRYQMEPDQLRERMEATGGMESFVRNINYNKTVDWLYDQSKVEIKIEEVGEADEDQVAPEDSYKSE